jgi:hypothetical protein
MFVIHLEIVTNIGILKMEVRISNMANIGTYCHCKTPVAFLELQKPQ